MATRRDQGNTAPRPFERNDAAQVLSGSFYAARHVPRDGASRPKEKPLHYKVICISIYLDTLKKLDEMVQELKRRGYTKASRSALLRHALDRVDLEAVPRGL